MALDKQNTRPAYLLGRLLAILQRTRLNADSITSKHTEILYTGLTSDDIEQVMTDPAREIHRYLLQAYEDIQTGAKYEWGLTLDRMLTEVVTQLVGFPETLYEECKSLCWIAYYHQKASFPAEMARIMDEINALPDPSPAPPAKMPSVN